MTPAVPLLDMYPEEMKPISQRDTFISMFKAMFFKIFKICKQWKCPMTVEWLEKMWREVVCVRSFIYIYVYMYAAAAAATSVVSDS